MHSLWVGIDPADAEARMRGLQRRLGELDEAMKAAQRLLAKRPTSFAAVLSLESLSQLQERLQKERVELVKYRRAEKLKIALTGHAFDDHRASIGQLGAFLIRVQKLYSSVGQAITTGPRLRGPISKDVLALTDMRFEEVFPSSFGMEIFIESHFDMFGESVAVSALQTTFNLLNAARRETEISRLAAELGSRSLSHLRHVLGALADADCGFILSWSDFSGTQYTWTASDTDIPQLRENLSKVHEKTVSEQQFEGVLIGASLLRDRFEFLVGDRLIEGKFTRSVKPLLREFFGQPCIMTCDQVEITDDVSDEKRTFFTMTGVRDSHA